MAGRLISGGLRSGAMCIFPTSGGRMTALPCCARLRWPPPGWRGDLRRAGRRSGAGSGGAAAAAHRHAHHRTAAALAGWVGLCALNEPGTLPRLRGDIAVRLAPGGAP
jgi:hypothetical protein